VGTLRPPSSQHLLLSPPHPLSPVPATLHRLPLLAAPSRPCNSAMHFCQ
jgi:hypothetical protein